MVCPSRPTRGALRTSRNARWDAVDADAAMTMQLTRTVKSCGPDVAVLASMHREATASQGATEAKEPFSGEITYKP